MLLRLLLLAGDPTCTSDDCPKVYQTDRNTFGIQGYTTIDKATPDGEAIVEIPEDTLREAVRALGW